jgi:asparagine synthase (glutamine-hydrolysing)
MSNVDHRETVINPATEQIPGLGVWLAFLSYRSTPFTEELWGRSFKLAPITVLNTEQVPTLSVFGEPDHAPPLFAEHALCSVIFDGLLYNREELRKQFRDSLPNPVNDAEVILQAYLRWGEEALQNIRGLFALVIWDGRHETLLCVRDRLGNSPLFYANTEREFVVSNSLEALVRHPAVSPTLNRPVIAEHLAHRFRSTEETFFENARRVPGGHLLRVRGGSLTLHRYWDPAPPGVPVNWLHEDELEYFDELFTQTIEQYLALGPAGIYLSGGLDSVSVAAFALDSCRRSGQPAPMALSLVLPDPETDETVVQKKVASHLGMPQIMLQFEDAIGKQGFLQADIELSRELSMPLLNPWLPAYRHLGLVGKGQGCQVILTGGGGDEWLGVSPLLAADLIRSLNFVELYHLWRSNRRSFRLPPLDAARFLLWSCGVRPLLYPAVANGLRRVIPEEVRKSRRQRQRAKSMQVWVAPAPALRQEMEWRAEQGRRDYQVTHESYYLREIRKTLDHPLISWELEEISENSRQMGVRVLQPYWDAEIIELLCRTPPNLLNKGGRSKGLVRHGLERRFPNAGFERQKKVSALNFFNNSLLQQGERVWESMGGARALAELGSVDAKLLDAKIHQVLANNQVQEAYRIWEVLVLDAWLRLWL